MSDKPIGILLSALILLSGAFGATKATGLHSQNIRFRVLHHFTCGDDGCYVLGGLGKDREGNLYGVAYSYRQLHGDGLLFKLTRNQDYKFHVLQNFSHDTGRECITTPSPDKVGNFFGVCTAGGTDDKGTLWEYSLSGQLVVLHSFTGPADGMSPEDSVDVDNSGDIIGTAYGWGPGGAGTLWKYSPSSGAFTLLHSFTGGLDGGDLLSGPRIDKRTGMVWGTTLAGQGTVWNYDPSSGILTTVVDFASTGIIAPESRLILSENGDVFGTAFGISGQYDCGLVYELSKDRGYAPVVVHRFTGTAINRGGCGLFGRVRFDDHGNLIGGTYDGGRFGRGTVYQLIYDNGEWREKTLHDFDLQDGWRVYGGLKTDHRGNWFGTTQNGGKYNAGTVFEISGIH